MAVDDDGRSFDPLQKLCFQIELDIGNAEDSSAICIPRQAPFGSHTYIAVVATCHQTWKQQIPSKVGAGSSPHEGSSHSRQSGLKHPHCPGVGCLFTMPSWRGFCSLANSQTVPASFPKSFVVKKQTDALNEAQDTIQRAEATSGTFLTTAVESARCKVTLMLPKGVQ